MANPYFQMKQFTVYHDRCAMKVTTDACLFGAWTADRLKETGPRKMLDVGTGSGLLSLMVAQQCKGTIDAVELDPEAARQAGENIDASPWKASIQVYAKDIHHFDGTAYDVVFSNPPFYEGDLLSPHPKKVQAHHDSSLLLSDLIAITASRLVDGGSFFLLLPYRRATAAEKLLEEQGLFVHQKIWVKQSVTHDPFRVMIEGKKGRQGTTVESGLAIRDKTGAYTLEFTRYLQPYYLYL